MRAAMCVPWRGGSPSREEAWRRVSGNGFPYPMFTGDSDPLKPFNRAAARNAAARAAGDVDVYVFNDADHAMSRVRTRGAAQLALDMNICAIPYTQIVVEDLETGKQWPSRFGPAYTSGNIAIPRTLFELAGGWDERFDAWGHEDIALSKLLVWLSGPLAYIEGPVLAFDHERAPTERAENVQAPPLFDRYVNLRSLDEALALAQEVKVARG